MQISRLLCILAESPGCTERGSQELGAAACCQTEMRGQCPGHKSSHRRIGATLPPTPQKVLQDAAGPLNAKKEDLGGKSFSSTPLLQCQAGLQQGAEVGARSWWCCLKLQLEQRRQQGQQRHLQVYPQGEDAAAAPHLPTNAGTEQGCYGDVGACAALPRGKFTPKTSQNKPQPSRRAVRHPWKQSLCVEHLSVCWAPACC